MGDIHVVVGGQFGSEGKGHVTGWLAKTHLRETAAAVVRVAGPNAGHTAYDDRGQAFAMRQIPVAAVTNPGVNLYIGAGSEIDPDVLYAEIRQLEDAGIKVLDRLYVDRQATVIEERHKVAEAPLVGAVGSTGKGIGAARADRLMRKAMTWEEWVWSYRGDVRTKNIDTSEALQDELRSGDVLIEGTQGYGLGLRAGYYPQCTSSDCRAIDFLSMAGLTPWGLSLNVWPVFRTFPIRVAGNSGLLREETSWDALSEQSGGYIKPERTTVTQKVRRVGKWDSELAEKAIRANGGPGLHLHPVLLFLDYLFPYLANTTSVETIFEQPEVEYQLDRFREDLGCPIVAVGTGPDSIVLL